MKTSKKKKLLVLTHNQFGSSTTSYKQCEFARKTYDITFMGWDYGLPRTELPEINIKYVSRKSNLIARNFRLLRAFHIEIRKEYDIILTHYVRGISFVRLLNPKANFLIHIVTLGVMPSRLKRFLFDYIMKIELLFFKNIVLINKGIGKRLRIKKFKVLPIGGEQFSSNMKCFDDLSLLYVGTLSNRNILDCVKGFHRFIDTQKQNGRAVNSKFTIIGDSEFDELKKINTYITQNKLGKYVITTGYINRKNLYPFFEAANVGVSYVPIQPYFQYQPPTKTYEYLISGLPVIATETKANKEIISTNAGILIQDNPESFCRAILEIKENKNGYNSDAIREQYAKYTWQNVVDKMLIPFLEEA